MSYDDQLAAMAGHADKVMANLKAPTADQRTIEWLQERVGHCTASMFAAVLDVTKKGTEGAKRRNYRTKLVVERIIGEPVGNYVNTAMEWGTQQEASARMAYEASTGAMIEEVGFLHHTSMKWVGGSPDGLIGKDGMIECKCPFEPAVHVTTILKQECEHLPQIQGLLWITGRQWCDFVSFDPRMPTGLQLYVKRIKRDDDYIAELGAAVIAFLAEVEKEHETLLSFAAQSQATGRAQSPQPESPSPVPAPAAPNAAPGQNKAATEAAPPPAPDAAPITETQEIALENALDMGGKTLHNRFRAQMAVKGIKSVAEIPASRYDGLMKWISEQVDKQNAEAT